LHRAAPGPAARSTMAPWHRIQMKGSSIRIGCQDAPGYATLEEAVKAIQEFLPIGATSVTLSCRKNGVVLDAESFKNFPVPAVEDGTISLELDPAAKQRMRLFRLLCYFRMLPVFQGWEFTPNEIGKWLGGAEREVDTTLMQTWEEVEAEISKGLFPYMLDVTPEGSRDKKYKLANPRLQEYLFMLELEHRFLMIEHRDPTYPLAAGPPTAPSLVQMLQDTWYHGSLQLVDFSMAPWQMPLGSVHCGDAAGIGVAKGMVLRNGSIRELILWGNSIADGGAEALAEVLLEDTSVQMLDLSNNTIGDLGAVALAKSLSVNKTLKQLLIQYNNLRTESFNAFGEAIPQNTALHTLDLRNNAAQDDGLDFLISQLAKNRGLKRLMVSHNKASQDLRRRVIREHEHEYPRRVFI